MAVSSAVVSRLKLSVFTSYPRVDEQAVFFEVFLICV